MMHRLAGWLLTLLLLWGVAAGCQREKYLTGEEAELLFSLDTLYFDTVFTTIGSTTRSFRVYNPHTKTVRIDEVRLAGGASSPFRINVDGASGPVVRDVEILPHDSLYLFVEVTIDPLGGSLPLLVHDSVLFITGGRVADVDLVAWGQDVHLFDGRIIGTQRWEADKPYLIVHSIMVDTGAVLTVAPGVIVHNHFGSTFYVAGTLRIEGTVDEPVIFTGDRLEAMYDDIPGQWSGIYFLNGSSNNRIDHAIIRNAVYGVHLGNFYAEDPPPDLRITNTVIEHMTWAGISSVGATIDAANCLVDDCGSYLLSLTTGGDYRFIHCTLANYWSWSPRSTPSVVLSDHYILNDTAIFTGTLVQAAFYNSIIYGDKEDEFVAVALMQGDTLPFLLDHVLLRKKDVVNDTVRYHTVFLNHNPGFVSVWENDYHLDSLAFAADRGAWDPALLVPRDMEDRDRLADGHPDLGAYERADTTVR